MVALNVKEDSKNCVPESPEKVQTAHNKVPSFKDCSKCSIVFGSLFISGFIVWIVNGTIASIKAPRSASSIATRWMDHRLSDFSFTLNILQLVAVLMVFLTRRFMKLIYWINIVLIHSMVLYGVFSNVFDTEDLSIHCKPAIAGMFILLFYFISKTFYTERKGIQWALDVSKEASRPVIENPSIIFLPLIPCMMQSTIIAFTLEHGMKFYSDYGITGYVFNVVMGIWTIFLIGDFSLMAFNKAFDEWYVDRNNDKNPPTPFETSTSFETSPTRHLGTIAFGTLASYMFRIPRIIYGVGLDQRSYRDTMIVRYMHNRHISGIRSDAENESHDRQSSLLKSVVLVLFGLNICWIVLAAFMYFESLENNHHIFPLETILLALIFLTSAFSIIYMMFNVYVTSIDTLILISLDEKCKDSNKKRPPMSKRMVALLESDAWRPRNEGTNTDLAEKGELP